MENEKNIFKTDLIPLLIAYKKNIGEVFPIEQVKHLTNEVIVERIKNCIEENKKYEVSLKNFNDRRIKFKENVEKQILSINDIKKIVPLVIQTMDQINYDYTKDKQEILDIIELRKSGKKFIFAEHLKALVIALLSNHRWGDSNIRNNIFKIDHIFHNYDKNYLKVENPNILIDELKKIHCTNPMIRKQIEALPYNIKVLEKIERDHGTLDNFVTNNDPNYIANCFDDGKYKLKQVGRAFTFDYLKRVGIDTCKTSTQLERLFGTNRLSLVSDCKATGGQVLSILKKMSELNNMKEIEIESILNQFCLQRSANICGESPNCKRCQLRGMCQYDKDYEMTIKKKDDYETSI